MEKIVFAFWQLYEALSEAHLLDELCANPVCRRDFRIEKGAVVLPGGIRVEFSSMEMSIYILFLRHPSGISTGELWQHYSELLEIYRRHSTCSDTNWMEKRIDDFCDAPYASFYSHISCIRRRIIAVMSPVDARRFCISRGTDGRYRISALKR